MFDNTQRVLVTVIGIDGKTIIQSGIFTEDDFKKFASDDRLVNEDKQVLTAWVNGVRGSGDTKILSDMVATYL